MIGPMVPLNTEPRCYWCGLSDAPLLPFEHALAHRECIELIAMADAARVRAARKAAA